MYKRVLVLEIFEGNKSIYETKTTSVGECNVFSGVFTEMLEGMFIDFPGDSGKVRTKKIKLQNKC